MKLRITEVKTFVVDAYRANYVFVKISTDQGLHGVGEATVELLERSAAAVIEDVAPHLIGQDPFRTDFHVAMINRNSYWRSGVLVRSALSGIEAALLDIKGKALGVPVYELLGGKHRDFVRCYANAWFVGARTPDEFGAKARDAVAAGFTALKWDPFGAAYLDIAAAQRNQALDTVAAVRDAVGPDVDLMIEGHGRFDVPTAIRFCKDLERYAPKWFEEPIPPESIDALAAVRRKSPIAIASGERYFDPASFLELLAKDAVDYVQPDVSHVGGIMEAKQIALMAHARYIPVAPHNPMGPIANAMTLHLAAATPNFAILETMFSDVPWRKDVVREDIVLESGNMMIPTGPGLGVDIDEEQCLARPFQPHPLRHYAGTLTDIRPASAAPFYRSAANVAERS